MSPKPRHPLWMSSVLWGAAAYNILWGTWVILAPEMSLRVCGFAEPARYPQIWQCVGMIVGVYGVGYAIAAINPIRHWPIVLVGLLGKLFGPVGMISAVAAGDLPLTAARTIVTNDLIWWVPFTWILWKALQTHRQRASNREDPLRSCALPRDSVASA